MISRKDTERSISSIMRKVIDHWLVVFPVLRNPPRVCELWMRKIQMVVIQWLRIVKKTIVFKTLYTQPIRTNNKLGLNDTTQITKMNLLTTSMIKMMTSICQRITSKMHLSSKVLSSQRSKKSKRRNCSTMIWDRRQPIWKRRKSITTKGTIKKLKLKSHNPKKCKRRINWSSFWSNRWRRSSRRAKPPNKMVRWTSATFFWDPSAPIWLFRTPLRKTCHSTMPSITWLRIVFSQRSIPTYSKNSRIRRCKLLIQILRRVKLRSRRRRRKSYRRRVKLHKQSHQPLLYLNRQ